MAGTSPLRAKSTPSALESTDARIQRSTLEFSLNELFFAAGFVLLALVEWIGYLWHVPRQPLAFTVAALIAVGVAVRRFLVVRQRARQLRAGLDGERSVGQHLERLRASKAQLFHNIPAPTFNLDHVVICSRGIFAIDTQTYSKPWPRASVAIEGDRLLLGGQPPEKDPRDAAREAAQWLENLLEVYMGKRLRVRGVAVFPGWYVEQRSRRGLVWVLEPKLLPGFIEQEHESISSADVSLATYHLSRYVRAETERFEREGRG